MRGRLKRRWTLAKTCKSPKGLTPPALLRMNTIRFHMLGHSRSCSIWCTMSHRASRAAGGNSRRERGGI
eukprot:3909056-Pyramimonas_sp.AAC.1